LIVSADIDFRIMTRFFKLVALALMLVVGTLPLLASASPSCRMTASSANAAPATHHCCPSMAMTAAGPSLVPEAQGAAPCCRISPAKPVRAVDLQMPAASVELALQPANEPVNALPVTTQAQSNYRLPLPDSASRQSHLCTFLI
jgi:hypothetical protein